MIPAQKEFHRSGRIGWLRAVVLGANDGMISASRKSKNSLTGDDTMNAVKIAAIVLIIAGALGLAYGSFSFTKETHEAKLGPIELSVKEKQTVNVPVWAGVGAIVIGGGLLFFGGRKS